MIRSMDMIWFAALTYAAMRSRISEINGDYDRFMLANVRELMRIRVPITLFIYLEEPEYGEEERHDKRHRQVREGMTADNRADRFEKAR